MGRKDRPPAWRRALTVVSSVALMLGSATLPALQAQAKPGDMGSADHGSVRVLVFHGPAAKQDDPVKRAAETVKDLGKKNHFSVDEFEDPDVFTAETLANYRAVVFLSANGVTLNADQEAAFRTYIKDGGGFVGVHDAARAQADSSWFTELIGTRPASSLPNPEKVVEVSASDDNPPNETKEKLFDGKNDTKWLAHSPTGWVQMKPEKPVAVDHYALTSANDYPGRDPKDWTLQGSQDGKSWTDLDKRSGESFPQRFQTKEYTFKNSTAYQYYRLDITANSGEPLTQLAELRLFGPTTGPPPEAKVQQATVDVTDRQHRRTRGCRSPGRGPTSGSTGAPTRSARYRRSRRSRSGRTTRVRTATVRSTLSRGAATTTAAGRSTPAWAAPRPATPRTRSSRATCSAPSSGRPAWSAVTARRPSRRTTRSSG